MFLLPELTLKQTEKVIIIAKATKSKNPHDKSNSDIIGTSEELSFNHTNQLSTKVSINKFDHFKSVK